jgi:nicotinamidase-related amidase
MPESAALLMDLQVDFLARSGARMPVDAADADRIIDTANDVLAGRALASSLPVLVLNRFPATDRLANFFRHGVAIAGSIGAQLDDRVLAGPSVRVFPKQRSSAFTNPELDAYLRCNGIRQLYVFGVFAEGCVRATAPDAMRHGYRVVVPIDAIGSNSVMKRRFAQWAMRRAGVTLVPSLLAPPPAT